MESSSENSFAWTDTSSDSFGSNVMVVDVKNKKTANSDHNNHNGKKSKEKKSSGSEDEAKMAIKEEQSYCETESNSSLKKNNIKLEPESDIDLPKKKKKMKHPEINGDQYDCKDSVSYDETYLHMKVKQEESASSSNKQKQKKRKRQSSANSTTSDQLKSRKKYRSSSNSESCNVMVSLKQESEHEMESSKSKKKKRKSKKQSDSDDCEDHNREIEDKMDIGETVVNKREQSNEILARNSQPNHASPATENNSFEEENEESGCDEISAIKCDDDHNLHTISFINQTTEENMKNYSNDSELSETTVRSPNKVSKNRAAELNSIEKSSVTNHRTPRISDRIRFEDEDDTNIVSTQVHDSDYETNKKSSKMKHFIKANPNLKLITQKFHTKSSLTLDDEIWILKCPKEVDIKAFNNTILKIHGKCKIKVNGQTYDGSAEEEQSDTITLLTMEHGKHKIHNLPLTGFINLRKRIPKAHFRDDNIMVNNQTNFIPLPETKCRHPLFGSNYKKALKIPAAIAERLNEQEIEETSMKSEKRKKKKTKKDRHASIQADSQIQSELVMKTETDITIEVSEKKRKKRKHADDDGPVPKKMKRIKHDPESAEAWESEKAIEENLFNF